MSLCDDFTGLSESKVVLVACGDSVVVLSDGLQLNHLYSPDVIVHLLFSEISNAQQTVSTLESVRKSNHMSPFNGVWLTTVPEQAAWIT